MADLEPPHAVTEPPTKRQKVAGGTAPSTTSESRKLTGVGDLAIRIQEKQAHTLVAETVTQSSREASVGIHHYVNVPNPGFSGVLKKRYTDFIVNEISLDGTVLYLTDEQALSPKTPRNVSNASSAIESSASNKPKEIILASFSHPTFSEIFPIEDPRTCQVATEEALSINSSSATASSAQNVVHDPKPLKSEDEELLTTLLGEVLKNEIIELHAKVIAKPNAKAKEFGSVTSAPILDRQVRSQVHQALRQIFNGHLESTFDTNTKGIIISAASKSTRSNRHTPSAIKSGENQMKGKVGWNERGGEFLHMSLCKQDRDTMEVISHIARTLKVKPNTFSYAGTKDRRAVTTQRVSAYRVDSEAMARINQNVYNAAIGNFKYEKQPLELGDLSGNMFTITLRDAQFPGSVESDPICRLEYAESIVAKAGESLSASGFINFYGLQRFGTFETGTHIIGKLILQGNYDLAVVSILKSHPDAYGTALFGVDKWAKQSTKQCGKDELARARAIRGFSTAEMKLDEVLSTLPRKFLAERNIIQYMKHRNSTDYIGALLNIPRNLRLMYVHAYQSWIWNEAASERFARYGSKVIAGDLVLVTEKTWDTPKFTQFDENGEIIVRPAAHDIALSRESLFERARLLTSEEAASGEYNISDIVLPLPGFDVVYPANDIGDFYKTLMSSERGGGLDPGSMRRKHKDFSLSGGYRKLIGTVNSLSFQIKIYHEENEQLVETDMDKILDKRAGEKAKKATVISAHPAPSINNSHPADLIQKKAGNEIVAGGSFVNGHYVPKQSINWRRQKYDSITANHPGVDTQQAAPEILAASEGARAASVPSSGHVEVSATLTQAIVIPVESKYKEINKSDILASEQLISPPALGSTTISGEPKIAIILKFGLSSSNYATVLLREIMGADNVVQYHPDFGVTKQ